MAFHHVPFPRWKHLAILICLQDLQSISSKHLNYVTALLSSHETIHRHIRDCSLVQLREGIWDDDVNGNNSKNFRQSVEHHPSHIPNINPQDQQLISTYYGQPGATSLTPLKVMIFIDGTWLYYQIYERNMYRDVIAQKLGNKDWKMSHEIDWTKLPMVACQALLQDKKSSWAAIMAPFQGQGGGTVQPLPQRPIEVMRVSVYSSMHRETAEDSYRFRMFKNMRKAGFDVNMKETLGPLGSGEKCVDIQLAVDMLYYATVQDAYDVALLLTGDRDFLPAVIRCRQKGRRIGIVSMRSAASIAFEETPNLKDYDTIWLEDYIEQWTKKIDRPLASSSNKSVKKISPPATASKLSAGRNASVRKTTTTKVSEYVLNKVVSDFISRSKEPKVSSRDVGRFLKNLEFGDESLLDQIKDAYGGLFQFLTLSDLFFVEGDSRWNVRAFWVGLIPVDERGVVPEKMAIPDDLSEEEVAFLVEYEQRPKLDEWDYEFTTTDRDPARDGDDIGVTLVKPGIDLGIKHKLFDLDKCTVSQLKQMCRENNLPVSGRKIELVDRIKEHFSLDLSVDGTAMEKMDPSTRLEMLVLEYVKASGGEASSRDVGRYLVVNKASSDRLSQQNNGKAVSALQELKELYGGLLKFVEWSTLCDYGRVLPGGGPGLFTIVAAPNAEHELREKVGSATKE
jgi:hypothetical protein